MRCSRSRLKPGDWLRCTLPKAGEIYGHFCQIEDIPTEDKGIRVAFPPMRPGWKPYRCALDDGHWEIPDPVTLLGLVVAKPG